MKRKYLVLFIGILGLTLSGCQFQKQEKSEITTTEYHKAEEKTSSQEVTQQVPGESIRKANPLYASSR